MRSTPSFPLPLAVLALLALGASACVRVPPYARGSLAHPTMATGDLARASEQHVRAVHEGASGGDFTAGGGCGCN
jgi:hypothetical protein